MKRLSIAIAAALLLTGCAGGQATGDIGRAAGTTEAPISSEKERADGTAEGETPAQNASEPPALSMAVVIDGGENEVGLVRNGYSWAYTDEKGKTVYVCADSPAPWQLSLNPFSLAQAESVRLKLADGAAVRGVYNWSADGQRQDVEFQPTGEICFPAEPTGDIYSVTVEYPSGSCDYVFAAAYEITPELTEYPCTISRCYAYGGEFSSAPEVVATEEALETYFSALGNESGDIAQSLAEKYPAGYFKDGALVLMRLEESSGSVQYSFCGIDREDNIRLKCAVPETGTCDMAYYIVCVEIPQDMAGREFGVITQTVMLPV